MDKNKSSKILKPNEIIRGNPLEISVDAKKLMNCLIWGIGTGKLKKADEVVHIKLHTLRKWMNLSSNDNYIKEIKDAVKSLATPVNLKNYTDTDGIKHIFKGVAFIANNYDYGKYTKSEKGIFYTTLKVQINKECFNLVKQVLKKGNYTILDWREYSNKFVSKYTIAIYEYLKSFHNSKHRYLAINLQELHSILGLKKPLALSEILRILNRCIKEITKKSDIKFLEIDTNKKNKIVTFYFIAKKVITAKSQKNTIKKAMRKILNKDDEVIQTDKNQRSLF